MSFPFPPSTNPEDNVDQPLPAGQEVPEDEGLSESSLPPEAQGETNGGPLGCCLGVTVGIMLSLLLGIIGFGPFVANGLLGLVIHTDIITNTRIATAIFALGGAIIFGYVGWKVGKRFYREYELTPRQKQKLERLERRYVERLSRKG